MISKKTKSFLLFLFININIFCVEKIIDFDKPIYTKQFETIGKERIQFYFNEEGRIIEEKYINNPQSFYATIDYLQREITSYNNYEEVLVRSISNYNLKEDRKSVTLENDTDKFVFIDGVLFFLRKDKEREWVEYYYTYSKVGDTYFVSFHEFIGNLNGHSYFDDYKNNYSFPQELMDQIRTANADINKFNA